MSKLLPSMKISRMIQLSHLMYQPQLRGEVIVDYKSFHEVLNCRYLELAGHSLVSAILRSGSSYHMIRDLQSYVLV